jgi:hypothetical protein
MTALFILAGILGSLLVLPLVIIIWAVALTYAMRVGRAAFAFREDAAAWAAPRPARADWPEETDAPRAAAAESEGAAAPVSPAFAGIAPAAPWQMTDLDRLQKDAADRDWRKFWYDTKDQPTSVTETGGQNWDSDEREPIERIDEAPRAPGSKLSQPAPD